MHPYQFDRIVPGTLLHRKTESTSDFYVLTAHYGKFIVVAQAKRALLVSALEIPIEAAEHWDIVHLRGGSPTK